MVLRFMTTRTFLSGIALAGLTITATGCATTAGADNTDGPSPNVSAMPAPPPGDMKAGPDAYMLIAVDIYGSAVDRWNAGRVQVHKMETAFTECMASHGFAHTPMDYSSSPMGQISPADGYDEFTELATDFGIGAVRYKAAELEGDYTDPGFTNLTAAEQDKWADLVGGDCAQPWEPGLENAHLPPSLHGVSEAFRVEVLEPVHNDPVVQKLRGEYGTCLAERGFTAPDWASLRTQASEQYPPVSAAGPPTIGALNSDTAWKAAQANELAAAEADVTCRSDMFAYATGLAYPALLEFTTTHATALAQLATEWNRMRQEYTALFG